MRGIQTVQRAEEWYSEQLSQVEDITKVPFAKKKNLDHTGTQRHRRDIKTQEGHKDTEGTQIHRRDTKTQEGEITHRHFRRIKGQLTDQKNFIRVDH